MATPVKRGFTLIETVVSTFIFALVMMAVFAIIPSSRLALKKAEMRVTADSIAHDTLERYRCRSFTELPLGAVDPAPSPRSVEGVTYTTSLLVARYTGSDPAILRILRVSVDYEYQSVAYQARQEAWVVNVTQ